MQPYDWCNPNCPNPCSCEQTIRAAMDPDPIPGSTSPGAHIWGWMSEPELDWLYEQARKMKTVVEIGTNRGRSAYALAKGTGENGGHLYAIDLWNDPGDHGFRAFRENVTVPLGNVTALRGRSPEILQDLDEIWSDPFRADMVFIDGDHSYESVRADIEAWSPRTSLLICGHDYVEGYQGVKVAVDEIFGGPIAVALDTSIWYVELRQDGAYY